MLLSEGDELAAAEQFKRALRVDESHAEANANLGAHYAKGGDWKKALPRLERAWSGGRQDSAIANNYALALKSEGEHERSRQIFEDATKRNNKDAILLLNYASLLIETLNRPKEGLPLVYRVKLLETERKDVLNRATALERKATNTSTP
jgi:Tfp pilus assembly protein PilF